MINSLRFRLTALYLVFFSLLFVLFSVLMYGLLSRSLYQRWTTRWLRRATPPPACSPTSSRSSGGRPIGPRGKS